jgi:CubicO group peptidase (beta-lactamase class C family)
VLSVVISTEALDALIHSIVTTCAVPGAALAVVNADGTLFAKGYGYRDLDTRLPMTPQTVYPIASTTKAINATLLAMLVEKGELAWDTPVHRYLPEFRLSDRFTSPEVTLRDLMLMRTGLPRHDWLWLGNPISRSQIVERLPHLNLSAGFRERFQYSNLSMTLAGHIAEKVTGREWESLTQQNILDPLGMSSTTFSQPTTGNFTRSYHESRLHQLTLTQRLASECTAPSGGAIHSTIEDMSRWVSFNLGGAALIPRALVKAETLAGIFSPQIMVAPDPSAPTPHAAYAMGWYVDTYNGCARVSHGGFLHNVHSSVMLFPDQGLGFVAFSNVGSPRIASVMNQHAFDLIMGFAPVKPIDLVMAQYRKVLEDMQTRDASLPRVHGTAPSHPMGAYVGLYTHPGYGGLSIVRQADSLILERQTLVLPLEHWHYDAWVAADSDFFESLRPHTFDRSNPILFDTNADGDIDSLSIRLEPAVSAVRFAKDGTGG